MEAARFIKRALAGTTALFGLAFVTPAWPANITITAPVNATQTPGTNDSLTVTSTGSISGVSNAVNVFTATPSFITNSGTLSVPGAGIDLQSSGIISGMLTNHGLIKGHQDGIVLVDGSDVKGGLMNDGTISGGFAGIGIAGFSDISGGLTNSGKIFGASGNAIYLNQGKLSGGIDSSGTISGLGGISIVGSSTVSGQIRNSGTIRATLANAIEVQNSDIAGGIDNSGTISGALHGVIVGSAGSASDISGGITNSGTIAGITGIRVDAGAQISGGITNSGVIEGTGGTAIEIYLGLAGPTAINLNGGRVIGDIIDEQFQSGVLLTIGGTFATEGAIIVPDITTRPGSVFTISGTHYVLAANSTVVNGTLRFGVDGTSQFGTLQTNELDIKGKLAVHVGSGTLTDGDELMVVDAGNITGGPGGVKRAISDDSLLWDFQIADGTAASVPTDASDLFLFVHTSSSPMANLYNLLQGFSGTTDPALQTALNNLNNAGTEQQQISVLQSVSPTVDGAGWNASRDLASAIFDQADSRFDGLAAEGIPHQSGAASGNVSRGINAWGQFFGHAADAGAKGSVAGYSSGTYGFTMGLETPGYFNSTQAGAALSYGRTAADSRNSNSTSLDIDTYQISLYADHKFDNNAYLRGIAAYGFNSNTNDRHNVGGLGGPTAHSEFNASQYAARAEAGRSFTRDSTVFTPSLLVNWLHYAPQSYTETGAGLGNLTVEGNSMEMLELGGGLKLSRGWKNIDGDQFLPEVHAGYRYDLVGDRVETSSVFAGGGAFLSQGPEPSRSRLNLGTGFTYQAGTNWDVRAQYDYDIRQDYHAHAGSLRGTFKF
jgi:uncharacterized protein with beta-barrel porin domain